MGQMLAGPVDQLLRARLLAILQLDEGARRFAPFVVRGGDHCGGAHLGMAKQRVFDLDRGNIFAARNDDVLLTVLQLDVPVGMAHAQIA